MPATRAKRLLCYTCSVPLVKDERDHYGYACHACVVREHELILTWRSDPDHPDVEDLHGGPVDLGLRPAQAPDQLDEAPGEII